MILEIHLQRTNGATVPGRQPVGVLLASNRRPHAEPLLDQGCHGRCTDPGGRPGHHDRPSFCRHQLRPLPPHVRATPADPAARLGPWSRTTVQSLESAYKVAGVEQTVRLTSVGIR